MPHITDPPPDDVQAELDRLRKELDRTLPAKELDRNLLLATWNIRGFNDLTDAWRSGDDDSPKRDLASLLYITEIVSRFDVVAIQEVRGSFRALRHMLKRLGPHWSFLLTDQTKGTRGNYERLAFVFDTRKVRPSGLACELVVPEGRPIGKDAFSNPDEAATGYRQFARTPYAAAFECAGHTFILVTLHVVYAGRSTADLEERASELREIASWLADWAEDLDDYGHNLIALGDFNIDRNGDALYDAFTSTGLHTPAKLHDVPRTLPLASRPTVEYHYDQIAWFLDDHGAPRISLAPMDAGHVDFQDVVLSGMDRNGLSWRISDHYPLWASFSTRPM